LTRFLHATGINFARKRYRRTDKAGRPSTQPHQSDAEISISVFVAVTSVAASIVVG
jgi:hypothetical protein